MKSVVVRRKEVLSKIQINKDFHAEELQEALLKRKQYVLDRLTSLIESIHDSEDYTIEEHLSFPMPKNHLKEYDRVIHMLEMSADELITLDAKDFDQYVMDNWSWKDAFSSLCASYN